MTNTALVLRLKSEINNPDAPYLIKHDPIESRDGSLFLWDAGLQKLSTSPSINDTIPNLLSEYTPASGKNLVLKRGLYSETNHNAYIQRELTSKGGIHFIVAQAYGGATNVPLHNTLQANAALQAALQSNVMGANPNLFVSLWTRLTRKAPPDSLVGVSAYTISDATKNNAAFHKQANDLNFVVSSASTATSHLNKANTDSAAVGQPNKNVMNLKGYMGTGVASDSLARFLIAGFEGPWGGMYANKSPSVALYRIYVEDLTLSGRTYAQVKAIDDAEFNKAFGVGGRFYGDTWSDPAAVLP